MALEVYANDPKRSNRDGRADSARQRQGLVADGRLARIEDLFRAYRGLALLGGKDEAIGELERLVAAHGMKFEADCAKEYAKRLKAARKW